MLLQSEIDRKHTAEPCPSITCPASTQPPKGKSPSPFLAHRVADHTQHMVMNMQLWSEEKVWFLNVSIVLTGRLTAVLGYGKKILSKTKQKTRTKKWDCIPELLRLLEFQFQGGREREGERLERISELMTVSERQRWRRKTSVCRISDLITNWYHIHKQAGEQSFTKEEHCTATLSSARHRHRKTEGCYTNSWNKGRKESALLMEGNRRSPFGRSVVCNRDFAVHTFFWGNRQFWLQWLRCGACFLLDDLLGFDFFFSSFVDIGSPSEQAPVPF